MEQMGRSLKFISDLNRNFHVFASFPNIRKVKARVLSHVQHVYAVDKSHIFCGIHKIITLSNLHIQNYAALCSWSCDF
jgi:hypothetical protein